jgi:hypothetical protein
MRVKQKQNPLVNKTRATFSIENELNEYLTEVSKATGYTRTAIIEELLRQNLYHIKECHEFGYDDSPIMRALEYHKEMKSRIK